VGIAKAGDQSGYAGGCAQADTGRGAARLSGGTVHFGHGGLDGRFAAAESVE